MKSLRQPDISARPTRYAALHNRCVLAAIARAYQYQTYDAAYVETILLQERRRQELPSPTPLRPKRQELIDEIDFEDPDPAAYDRLLGTDEQEQEENDQT